MGNVITSERNRKILRWLLLHKYETGEVQNLLSVFLTEETLCGTETAGLEAVSVTQASQRVAKNAFCAGDCTDSYFSVSCAAAYLSRCAGGRVTLWAIER